MAEPIEIEFLEGPYTISVVLKGKDLYTKLLQFITALDSKRFFILSLENLKRALSIITTTYKAEFENALYTEKITYKNEPHEEFIEIERQDREKRVRHAFYIFFSENKLKIMLVYNYKDSDIVKWFTKYFQNEIKAKIRHYVIE